MEDRYLYRAKRKDNGEWITGSLIQADYIGTVRSWISSEQDDKARLREISSNQAVWRAFEVRTDTICQCTGLKDKNGKLIWENDIVKINGVVYICFWNESNFEWGFKNNAEDFGVAYISSDDIRITGNIFDNPELLEVVE